MNVQWIPNVIGQRNREEITGWYSHIEIVEFEHTLDPGDLLEFNRFGIFSHWAVYAGRIENIPHIVELSKRIWPPNLIFAGYKIQHGRMQMGFGSWVRINNSLDTEYIHSSDNEEMNARINKFRNENFRDNYHLLECNCEHFAKYCRYGIAMSAQAEPCFNAANGLKIVREDGKTSWSRLEQRLFRLGPRNEVASLFEVIGVISVFAIIAISRSKQINDPIMLSLRWWTLLFGLTGGFSGNQVMGLACMVFVCGRVGVGFVLGHGELILSFELLARATEFKLGSMASVFGLTGVASLFGMTGVASLFGAMGIAALFQIIGIYVLAVLGGLHTVFGVGGITSIIEQKNADGEYEQQNRDHVIFGLADVRALFTHGDEEFGLKKIFSWFLILSLVSVWLLMLVALTFGMSSVITIFGLIGATSLLRLTGFDSMVGLVGVVSTFAMTNLTCVFGLINFAWIVRKCNNAWFRLDCTILLDPLVMRSFYDLLLFPVLFVFGSLAWYCYKPGVYQVCKVMHCFFQLIVFFRVLYQSDPSFWCFLACAIMVVSAVGLGKGALLKLRNIQRQEQVAQDNYLEVINAEHSVI